MERNIFFNKKTGQMSITINKKDIDILGVKNPTKIELFKKNFLTNGKEKKR